MTKPTPSFSADPIRAKARLDLHRGFWGLVGFAVLTAVLGGCSTTSVQAPAAQTAAAPAPDPRKVWDLRDLDSPPRAIVQTAPQYPEGMRARRIDGEAEIAFIVDRDGTVLDAYAIRATTPEFAEAALAAVRSWHFSPPRRGGKPVRVRLQVPIHFSVSGTN